MRGDLSDHPIEAVMGTSIDLRQSDHQGLPNKPLNLTKSPLRWTELDRFLTGAFAG